MMGLSHNALWVLASMLMLGTAAGLAGCFAYWKRQSLMSDALAHAALPGVVIGFAILGFKSLPVMLLGAAASALLGAWAVTAIRAHSRVKEDTAMGIILSVFFGLGIMLLTMVNRMPGGGQSGLDGFIFGQAAAMVRQDMRTMTAVAAVVLLVVLISFKEWKLYLFDPAFARGIGLSGRLMEAAYLTLLVVIIVIGIQAVGVILMAALLIIPAVSARYWTNAFGTMLALSALFGGGAGVAGTYVSTLGDGWPTGPFIVIAAAGIFLLSLVFGTRKGLFVKAMQRRAQMRRLKPQAVRRDPLAEGEALP
ncbi:Mn2+/Zn2+ ABC transporter permease, mntC [Thermobacillus xylanilyticus]|jgi:manganese/zinc/iron transport system permease protein|uniref:Mn2+/Zn2+ ABC transporter permease, mntC n=1 Tax=Thermobacillus xylanilyticus TaxID=76633 RepID=A0ABM8UZL1_THEXY|nr:metal ABC transporter permease [Thermobacillus xylanilyticus]REJ14771.1 MAG: manganese ABC transporter [Paenibacillaceae bacterium]CAG5077054.1 Mn2+/Zn2+ ABC transporter permease, mntC [Thermobacillus xylanilyticus]